MTRYGLDDLGEDFEAEIGVDGEGSAEVEGQPDSNLAPHVGGPRAQ